MARPCIVYLTFSTSAVHSNVKHEHLSQLCDSLYRGVDGYTTIEWPVDHYVEGVVTMLRLEMFLQKPVFGILKLIWL